MTSIPIAEPPPREARGGVSRRSSTDTRASAWRRCSPFRSAGWSSSTSGRCSSCSCRRSGTPTPSRGEVVHEFTLDNFRRILETDVFRDVAWRTVKMAVLVTIADVVLAFPIAYYMARVASPRTRDILVIAVLMPLWANYLVKACLADHPLRRRRHQLGDRAARPHRRVLHRRALLTFTYLWLPFMILPVYAGWSASRSRCLKHRPISVAARCGPSPELSCRSRSRPWSRARSSPSR